MKHFTAWIDKHDVHIAAHQQIYQGLSIYLNESSVKQKMNVGIMTCHKQSQGYKNEVDKKPNAQIFKWADILITEELKSNPVKDEQTSAWLNLITYVQKVFCTQDWRFVLEFTLCESMMCLWQFNWSGSSEFFLFNINEDEFKFIHVMLDYCLMNDMQLSLDPTIQQADSKRYMKITQNDKIEQLILTKNIKKQAMIVN